ncbi:MAG TPA: aldose 1-epimerase family protein [Lacipirellulaceae bacterium]|jgi:hypothetical protein|nr:aldose 1-epimerase family protein [Lacipirellulaceae bacterium]
MTSQTHVLIGSVWPNSPDPVEFRGERSAIGQWRVRMHTLRGGRSEGVQVIELDNGAMAIDVLPTRGMGIWRVRRGDSTLGWQAPAERPVNPCFVPLMEPAGLGWLEGFNELLCRCGLESNGPPEFDDSGHLLRPLHGRIANTPAHRVELIVDEDAGQITLRGVVDESRFHFQSLRLTSSISTSVDSNCFTWSDDVENIGGRDAILQMLYHFNIGQPLLRPGARIAAPLRAVAPHSPAAAKDGIDAWHLMPPPRPGSDEHVFVTELAADDAGNTRVLVSGLTDDNAVCLRFNKRTLPCFTVWRNTPSEADGYVLGIEPGTNYPNPRSFEQQHGRVATLKPGQIWSATVAVAWHEEKRSIDREEEAIEQIQRDYKTDFLAQPRADWSK